MSHMTGSPVMTQGKRDEGRQRRAQARRGADGLRRAKTAEDGRRGVKRGTGGRGEG